MGEQRLGEEEGRKRKTERKEGEGREAGGCRGRFSISQRGLKGQQEREHHRPGPHKSQGHLRGRWRVEAAASGSPCHQPCGRGGWESPWVGRRVLDYKSWGAPGVRIKVSGAAWT